MAGVTEEAAKAVGGFMSVMGQQPLALALVVMNLVLLGFLFYNGSSVNTTRQATVEQILKSQLETDKMLAGCVSAETNRTMLDHMQKITETMLTAEQKEIQRMQESLSKERENSYQLRERETDELNRLKKEKEKQSPQPEPNAFAPKKLSFPVPPLPPLPPLPPKGSRP
jgi:hypothetical protein